MPWTRSGASLHARSSRIQRPQAGSESPPNPELQEREALKGLGLTGVNDRRARPGAAFPT